MTAIIDLHGVVANLLGGQQAVLEQHTGHRFDPALFTGGTDARRGGHLEFTDDKGVLQKVSMQTFDRAMDRLFGADYLDLVQLMPGAKEGIAALRKEFGDVWILCKTGSRVLKTHLTCSQIEAFVTKHGLEVAEVMHFKDEDEKVGWYATAPIVIDNELPILVKAIDRGLTQARFMVPPEGTTGWKALARPQKLPFGVQAIVGWDEIITEYGGQSLAA